MPTLTIRRPDDFHVHLRNGAMLEMTLDETAKQFARALVMPNLRPNPVLDRNDAIQYMLRIADVARHLGIPGFEPLMTVQLTEATDEETVRRAAEAGVVAAKLYPAGVTTNSDNGVADVEALWPALKAMEGHGMMLCVHGEHPGAQYDDIDREAAFMPVLRKIANAFPDLKIVLEHVSHRAGVATVLRHENVAGTVTPQHLVLTMDDVFGPQFRPHNFCKPTAKRKKDRDALLDVVLNGHAKFFLGTDSAPHLAKEKHGSRCPAGVFSAPVAMPLLATVFERHGAIDRLEDFTSRFGAEWYGLAMNGGTLTLVREPWTVPNFLGERDQAIPPEDQLVGVFMGGETLPWRVAR